MGERVLLDRAADVAQRLEFGQPRNRISAAQRKPALHHHRQRALEIFVGEAGAGVRLEIATGREHRR